MNRRDFLKQAGVLAVAAPAAASTLGSAAADASNRSSTKELLVTFNGPFCYWWQGNSVIVMAPPVGPDQGNIAHQPWVGTTTNESIINVDAGTNLALSIPGYTAGNYYKSGGTYWFGCHQGEGAGALPLFNLTVPTPYAVIGVRPTAAKIHCNQVADPYCQEDCNQWKIFASGLTFVYPIVNLTGVSVQYASNNSALFTPCFTNDDYLPEATLGVNLSPLNRMDLGHEHAKQVWKKMVSMYPWMESEIDRIEFCENFNPASCNFDPSTCISEPPRKGPPQFGPGSDCQVPIMGLTPGGGGVKRRK